MTANLRQSNVHFIDDKRESVTSWQFVTSSTFLVVRNFPRPILLREHSNYFFVPGHCRRSHNLERPNEVREYLKQQSSIRRNVLDSMLKTQSMSLINLVLNLNTAEFEGGSARSIFHVGAPRSMSNSFSLSRRNMGFRWNSPSQSASEIQQRLRWLVVI